MTTETHGVARGPYMALDETLTRQKETFLAVLHERGNVYRAATAAGVSRALPYLWRDRDPDFAAAWDEAIENNTDNLEESLQERALTGEGMPAVIATIATLKARRPQKWSEKHIVVASEGAGELASALNQMAQLIAQANAAKLPEPPPTSYIEGVSRPADSAEAEQ